MCGGASRRTMRDATIHMQCKPIKKQQTYSAAYLYAFVFKWRVHECAFDYELSFAAGADNPTPHRIRAPTRSVCEQNRDRESEWDRPTENCVYTYSIAIGTICCIIVLVRSFETIVVHNTYQILCRKKMLAYVSMIISHHIAIANASFGTSSHKPHTDTRHI